MNNITSLTRDIHMIPDDILPAYDERWRGEHINIGTSIKCGGPSDTFQEMEWLIKYELMLDE